MMLLPSVVHAELICGNAVEPGPKRDPAPPKELKVPKRGEKDTRSEIFRHRVVQCAVVKVPEDFGVIFVEQLPSRFGILPGGSDLTAFFLE
jgi:hypothetical protein